MGTTMSETTSAVQPLPIDKIHIADEYYGVKVAELGEDHDEGIVAFTHDKRRAIAAVNRYCREQHKSRAETIDLTPLWWQVYDNCGCGDTCAHAPDGDGDVEHTCERLGLLPCVDETFTWIGEKCGPNAPGAIGVLEGEVSFG